MQTFPRFQTLKFQQNYSFDPKKDERNASKHILLLQCLYYSSTVPILGISCQDVAPLGKVRVLLVTTLAACITRYRSLRLRRRTCSLVISSTFATGNQPFCPSDRRIPSYHPEKDKVKLVNKTQNVNYLNKDIQFLFIERYTVIKNYIRNKFTINNQITHFPCKLADFFL